jgi:hypothetical protein
MSKSSSRFLGVALATALAIAGSPAFAQSLQGNISCLKGDVNAYDWAEMSQVFAESAWDNKATLNLNSDDEELTLKVLDLNNNSLCENVADLRTKCTWTLNKGTEYNVVIDNTMRSTQTTYTLCAQ